MNSTNPPKENGGNHFIEYDPDGVAAYIDKYLDVVFTPQGDVKIDDRDELDEALQTGDVAEGQYQSALAECDRILEQYCADIEETEMFCLELLECVLKHKYNSYLPFNED